MRKLKKKLQTKEQLIKENKELKKKLENYEADICLYFMRENQYKSYIARQNIKNESLAAHNEYLSSCLKHKACQKVVGKVQDKTK